MAREGYKKHHLLTVLFGYYWRTPELVFLALECSGNRFPFALGYPMKSTNSSKGTCSKYS